MLAAKLRPDRAVAIPWVLPPVQVSGAHVAAVVGAWLGALLVAGALLAWRRDGQE